MTSDRIKEIQETTACPESVSVKQALLQVWNECEQEQVKNCKQPQVSGSTRLKLKKEWKTPYNHFQIGDNSELQYFAQKLGKTTQQLIDDFENGSLDSWFEKM